MKSRKVSSAWLTVTHLCNLRCKWCYQRELGGEGKTMPKELANQLVDLLAELGLETIVLIGGEPTLYDHFFTLIKYIKTKGMRVNMVSNGLAFANQGFLDEAVEIGVDDITTSVKGSSREEYKKSTGYPLGYDLILQAIRAIQKTPIRQKVFITVSYSIIQNWNNMVRFVKECEGSLFLFSFEKPTLLSGGRFVLDERMMPEKVAPFVQEVMYPSLVETGLDFKIDLMSPQCYFPEEFINQIEAQQHIYGGCFLLGSKGIIFDPKGFVLPCNHFLCYPLGKYGIDFKTINEFLKWRETDKIRRFYETTSKAPCEECAKCSRWDRCSGGCRLWWLYQKPQELFKLTSVN